MTEWQWGDFENLMLEFARIEAEIKKFDQYDYTPPKQIVTDLDAIDKALTCALQILKPMRLEHRDGQDISKTPFNWPVVNALKGGWLTKNYVLGNWYWAKDRRWSTHLT
ncbi:hypothetical protein KR99_24805 [Ralstonia solanacearum]|uniref:hypothetical protein n=1 Tax=Ralstonia solanacearum TaxID=305 RepID=UPI000506D2D0|nr:hypothetical protein [Ralstonia solanacearum]KFX81220.1 hypothetical protein KR99_24805 [Ralstonia solanacearum]